MTTLGELVDRLSIVNLKIFHLQDWLYEISKEATQDFLERNHAETHANLKKLADLNLDRNRLMTAIDQVLDGSIRAGKGDVDNHTKVT